MFNSLILFLLPPKVSMYAKFKMSEATVRMHKSNHASNWNLRINLVNC